MTHIFVLLTSRGGCMVDWDVEDDELPKYGGLSLPSLHFSCDRCPATKSITMGRLRTFPRNRTVKIFCTSCQQERHKRLYIEEED